MTQHEKISVELRKRLDAMRPGERFPSEPELCREFGVARMTVNRVVTELVRDGRLVRQRGRGSFVAEVPREHRVVNYLLPCAGYLADPRAQKLGGRDVPAPLAAGGTNGADLSVKRARILELQSLQGQERDGSGGAGTLRCGSGSAL